MKTTGLETITEETQVKFYSVTNNGNKKRPPRDLDNARRRAAYKLHNRNVRRIVAKIQTRQSGMLQDGREWL